MKFRIVLTYTEEVEARNAEQALSYADLFMEIRTEKGIIRPGNPRLQVEAIHDIKLE